MTSLPKFENKSARDLLGKASPEGKAPSKFTSVRVAVLCNDSERFLKLNSSCIFLINLLTPDIVSSVSNTAGNTWQINFSPQAMFTEGKMDFTANLLFPGPSTASIISAYSCPKNVAAPVAPATTVGPVITSGAVL